MIFSFLVMLKIFDIENIRNNPEWISECIRGSFKSPDEYLNIFVVVFETEYFRIWIYSMGIIRIFECIRGSFKSPNEYPNIFVVVLTPEYFRISIYLIRIIRISECIRIFVTLWDSTRTEICGWVVGWVADTNYLYPARWGWINNLKRLPFPWPLLKVVMVTVTMRYSLKIVTVTMYNLFLN